MLGWEAARANAKPALIIQAVMLALAIAFYTNRAIADVLADLAEYKRAHGLTFVVIASIIAGAVIPEIFLIFFFQLPLFFDTRPPRRSLSVPLIVSCYSQLQF